MTKQTNVKSVRTPGDLNQLAVEAEELDALIADTGDVSTGEPPKTGGDTALVTMSKEDLAELVRAEVQRGVNQHLRAIEQAKSAPASPAELPRAKDIDPYAIDREVLTDEGYVVPARLGAAPAHLKNLG